MKRNKIKLEEAVARAQTPKAKALAYYNLGLFHDNNSREAEAIPNYEKALELGLSGKTKAQALAWLASSLYKTHQSQKALQKVQASRESTQDEELLNFLAGLEKRVQSQLR